MSQFDQDQKEFWNEHTNLRPYDHPIVRAFAQQRVALIGELLGNSVINRAFEVGCGDGFGTYYMRQLVPDIYGCDNSLLMLQQNPIDKNLLCQADAYALPYADSSFDLVYCWELLHHIHDPMPVVREMARVSRNYILIFEPNCFNPAQFLFGLLMPSERGSLRCTPWYLKRLLTQAELKQVRALTGGCFTPNRTLEWLYRLLRWMPYKWPLIGVSNIALGEVVRRPVVVV